MARERQRDFIHVGPDSESLTSHLGSTRVIVDSTGAVKSWFDYHPYGTLRASQVTTVDTKHRYTGKEHDSDDILNQDYFGARYLHGNTLRFTAVDPQAARYPGWSPYCYALCDPMRLVDPDVEFVLVAVLAAAAYFAVDQFVFSANTANAPETPRTPVEPGRTVTDDVVDAAIGGATAVGVGLAVEGTARLVGRIGTEVVEEVAEAGAKATQTAQQGIYEVTTKSGKTYVGQSG